MSLWNEACSKFERQLREDNHEDPAFIEGFMRDTASEDDVKKAVESIQSDSNSKYGSGDSEGKVKSAKWIGRIMKTMEVLVTCGDVAMKAAPESIGIAWFAVSSVLGAIQNDYKLYNLFNTSLQDIVDMLVLVRTYDGLYQRQTSKASGTIYEELNNCIREVYVAILDFSYAVRKYITGGKRAALKHSFKNLTGFSKTEFQEKTTKIQELRSRVERNSQAASQKDTSDKTKEMMDMLRELKKLRPTSYYELAMEEYEKNMKSLQPSLTTNSAHRVKPDEGTCTWINEISDYKHWLQGDAGRILCITGEKDFGKSVLGFYICEKLRDEANNHLDPVAEFISADEGSKDGKLRSIENTLLRIFYTEATHDTGNEDLLQQCNRLFLPQKQQKSTDATGRSQNTGQPARTRNAGSENTLDFVVVSQGILARLQKRFMLVIDNVDGLLEDDQDKLAKDLESLCAGQNPWIRILLLCRERSRVLSKLNKDVTKIKIADYNKNDINLLIQRGLEMISGIFPEEKAEIESAIVQRTGHQIKYVKQVALPFLRTPLYRPVKEWLKELPRNVDGIYHRHLLGLTPKYHRLLRTALRWALTARQRPRLEEIMESYSGMYTDGSVWDEQTQAEPELTLYQEQVQSAAGPFLEIRDGETVALGDAQAVRDFCNQESGEPRTSVKESLCAECKKVVNISNRYSLLEPEAHLEMAITCLTHLNSASFQARHFSYLLDRAKIRAEEKSFVIANGADNLKPDAEAPLESRTDNEDKPGDETENPKIPPQSDVEGEKEGEDGKKEGEETKDEDEDDSVFSDQDDEDVETVASEPNTDLNQDNKNEESAANESGALNDDTWVWPEGQRYEVISWFYHVQEAERLPSSADRRTNSRWVELLHQMEQFFLVNTVGFEAWKIRLVSAAQEEWDPLFWSAKFGLVSLAELLLEKGARITDRTPSGEGVLHIASQAPVTNRLEILRFFLSRGADPNFETEDTIPAFHKWLADDANAEFVKEMLQDRPNRASCSLVNRKWKWNALHYVGLYGTDKEVLDCILDNTPSEERRSNFDVRNSDGETPLHLLLSRRKIPLEFLKVFLDCGADVDVDDNYSERPLYEAAYWGEYEAVNMIVTRVKDVDDESLCGRTALHAAAWSGQLTTVEILLQNGANPNRPDKHGRTPLLFACLKGMYGVVPNGKHEATAELLIQKQIEGGASFAQTNAVTKRGRTPLREAAARGFVKVVDTILKQMGPDDKTWIDHPDEQRGRTPLQTASFHGQADTVAVLLRNGADASLRDGVNGTGKTSLELCIEGWTAVGLDQYEVTIVQLINERMDEAKKKSKLVLTTAAMQGSKTLLEKLENAGFDLSLPDDYGWPLSQLASLYGHTEAETYIKQSVAGKALRPTRWVVHNEIKSSTILKDDGIRVSHREQDRVCISSDHPVPANHPNYYYEIEILDIESGEALDTTTDDDSVQSEIAIGFSTSSAAHLIDFPGMRPTAKARNIQTWAYNGDTGYLSASNSRKWSWSYGPSYGPGDTVGCGVEIETKTIFFTKNGTRIDDHIFTDIKGRMVPVLGLNDKIQLRTNFGADPLGLPFKWPRSRQREEQSGGDEQSSKDGQSGGDEQSGKDGQLGKDAQSGKD